MRGRGLKLADGDEATHDVLVALRAGAWIETKVSGPLIWSQTVALRAGAWIETDGIKGKGLKLYVALRAGAWIETPGRHSG